MRILQINTEGGWRGGERQTLLTALGLRSLGHHVELLVRADGALAKRAQAQGLVVREVGSSLALGRWLARQGGAYDVLQAQTAKAVTWVVLTKWLHRRPIVFSRRTSFPIGSGAGLTRWKWARVDKLVAISESSAQAPRDMGLPVVVIRSAVPPVVANPQRVREFVASQGLQGRRLVGTAAALTTEKDPVTLIRAAAAVCARFEDVVFVHWGAPGEASALAQQALDAAGLGDRYRVLGFEAAVEQLYPALAVFVMASRFEALGSSVLDAMSQRVPVVATEAGGLKETLADGRGLLGPVGDASAMAANISLLLNDPARAAHMADQAMAYLQAEHDVADMVKRYLAIYAQVAGDRHPAASP